MGACNRATQRTRLSSELGLAVMFLACLLAAGSYADIYDGSGGVFNFDLTAISPTVTSIAINTDDMKVINTTPGGGGQEWAGSDDGGVCVFRFRYVNVPATVAVTVSGSRPMSFVSNTDMYWGASLVVAPGSLGGGAGGGGGKGGNGGVGGAGSAGGAGGYGGAGARGPSGWYTPGSSGERGGDGANSGAGGTGGSGEDGGAGQTGGNGFGGLSYGTPGTGGTGGSGGSGQGQGGLGVSGRGTGGNGGSGGAGIGGDGGNGSNGTSATLGGNNGSNGASGQDAPNPGLNAAFGVVADSLVLAGGPGGGGGGGGGGGQGGGGGSGGCGGGGGGGGGSGGSGTSGIGGGGGSGGSGGGGGGGGGAGCGGGAGGGNSGAGMGSNGSQGTDNAGIGGNGSHTVGNSAWGDYNGREGGARTAVGPAGSSGGAGGSGGVGGAGGVGAAGGSGGGAIVLGARGLLRIAGSPTFGVSASMPSGSRSNGAGGRSGRAGGAGINPGDNWGNGGGGTGVPHGGGGRGGRGGSSTGGGSGGTGATGGRGGLAGYGTPGMVKLMGSVIEAGSSTVAANNVAGTAANQNGKFTFISNMTATSRALNDPSFTTSSTVAGATRNDIILTQSTNAPYETSGTAYPRIPTMNGGPATHGWCASNYWNKGTVDVAIPDNGQLRYYVFTQPPVGTCVFDGYDQIVVKNSSTQLLQNVVIKVGSNAAQLIDGYGGTAGELGAGQVWTTTVTAGTSVIAGQLPTITGQPVSTTVNFNATATFTVTASGSPLSYQWKRNGVPLTNNTKYSGATAATLYIYNATRDDQATYSCDVSALGNTVSTSLVTLGVVDPTIVDQPISRTVDPTDHVTFTVNAAGSGTLTYQWTKGGTPLANAGRISGVDTFSLSIQTVEEGDTGSYVCNVTGVGGTVSTNPATLSVNDPPVITDQSGSLTVDPGEPVTFSVTVTGSAPLSYQWRKDGVDITDATTSSYTIPSAQELDEGAYRCYIANSAGTKTNSNPLSVAAILTVNDPPQIVTDPVSQTVTFGDPVEFSVLVTGSEPISYQWRKDGMNIADATTSTYSIAAADYTHRGDYDCVVTNSADTDTSLAASLTVADPVIRTQPESQVVLPGANVTFTVVAEGSGVLLYQWSKDGGDIADATLASLSLSNVQPDSDGSYVCRITGDGGTISTDPATLTVQDPAILTHPTSRTVNPGAVVIFNVVAGGSAPFSFQWKKDGDAIADATETSYGLAATEDDEGSYVCEVTNSKGTAVSNAATLSVNDPPVITAQPVSKTLNPGQICTFTVTASGTPMLSYQWRKGGTAIPGATNYQYTIPAVSNADEGNYACVVTNVTGVSHAATSDTVSLTVNDLPVVTVDPVSATIDAGDPLTLTSTIAAGATLPVSYQWRKNGGNIAGASGTLSGAPYQASYSIGYATLGDTGQYTCYFWNVGGSDESAAANLSVIHFERPTIGGVTAIPPSAVVPYGGSASFTVQVSSGTPPFSYQWKKDGVDVPGGTGITLSITNAGPSDVADYTCTVTNPAGFATSDPVHLRVGLTFVQEPQDQMKYIGENAQMSVLVEGNSGAITYEWKFEDETKAIYTVGHDRVLTINPVFLGDAGQYWCEATDSADTYASGRATFDVAAHLAITAQPLGGDGIEGQSHTFVVGVSGGFQPLSYQWRREGIDIPGATGSSYTIPGLEYDDAGTYSVQVSDANTDVRLSDNAVLTVSTGQPAVGLPGLLALLAAGAGLGIRAIRRKR